MKKILLRVKDITNVWETDDACIVETGNGKKWVCERFFESMGLKFATFAYIANNDEKEFITLTLKGKSDK